MPRSVWAVPLVLLASTGGAQQPSPGVPDITAMQTLWARIRTQLVGPNGEKWFKENMQDAELPYLHGIVVAGTPKDQPRVLVLAMSDKSTPEVILAITSAQLPEGAREGTGVSFLGIASAFSKQPFRLAIRTEQPVRVDDSR
jgi:hypothetical protein